MKTVIVYLLIWLAAAVASRTAGGVSSLYSGESESRDARSHWLQAQGIITDSKVAINGQDEHPDWNVNVWFAERPHWDITVWFTYVVKGVHYSGEQRWYTDSNYKTRAQSEQLKYSPGKAISVSYNPHEPEKAFIEPTKPSVKEADAEFIAVGVGGLLGGLGTWVLAWRRGWL